MDSISKCRKSEDRISNLPECLISHILSFLPTIEAVRSSILSTFWRRQWTSTTRLSFCDTNSLPPTSYVGFVYHVLISSTVTELDEFEFYCFEHDRHDTTHINAWFALALSRHVRRVVFGVGLYVKEPLLLHSCATLEVLDLGYHLTLSVPSSISLVSLRILRLRYTDFLDDESFSRLVLCCPVLEELNIQEGLTMFETINISSITLKRLIISFSTFDCREGFNYNLVVNTPSLQYFKNEDDLIPKSYKFQNLPCLDTVRIDVVRYDDDYDDVVNDDDDDDDDVVVVDDDDDDNDDDDDDEHEEIHVFKPMSDLAAGISSVRILHIGQGSFEALSRSPSQLPKFPRLTNLKIDGLTSTGWRLLMAFLESSPQLATLSFEAVLIGKDSNWLKHFKETCVPLTCVPCCMMSSLEAIEVNHFYLSKVELEIVRYFLKQSKCLKKLVLDKGRCNWKGKMPMVREKLLKFPRSSPSCEVVFKGD